MNSDETTVLSPDIAEVQADVEATRAQLGATVDELAARADVKARAEEKVEELKAEAKAKVRHARHVMGGQVSTGTGIVKDAAGHRNVQIAAAAAVALTVALVWRKRRG